MREQLVALYDQLMADTIAWAPRLVLMLVLVIAGFVVAWVGERIVRLALRRLHVDALMERSGVDRVLQRGGVRTPIGQLMPRIAFWLLVILFANAGADVLGLIAVSDAISAAMGYVPNVLAAVLILMIGTALAQFAGRAVNSAATSAGIQFARVMGSVTTGFILFVIGLMAIAQLRIDTGVVQLVAGAVLAGLALGFGLALGLGSREVLHGVLAGFYARQLLRVGEEVQVGGSRGKLISITPTQLLLETDTEIVTVPNVVLLREGGRQARS